MAIVICVLQRSIAYRPVRPCTLKYAGEQPGAVTVNTVLMISNFPSGLRHRGVRATRSRQCRETPRAGVEAYRLSRDGRVRSPSDGAACAFHYRRTAPRRRTAVGRTAAVRAPTNGGLRAPFPG